VSIFKSSTQKSCLGSVSRECDSCGEVFFGHVYWQLHQVQLAMFPSTIFFVCIFFNQIKKKKEVWICKDAQHLWKKTKKTKTKQNSGFLIAATSIFITDIFHQCPRKWRFCSLQHMWWKPSANVLCDIPVLSNLDGNWLFVFLITHFILNIF